jgi:hypothetical protein
MLRLFKVDMKESQGNIKFRLAEKMSEHTLRNVFRVNTETRDVVLCTATVG